MRLRWRQVVSILLECLFCFKSWPYIYHMAAIYEAGISIIPKTGVTMSAISGAYKRVHMAWNTSVHCITVLERMVMLTKLLVLRTGVFFLVFYFFSIFRIYRIMGAALIGILLPLILLLSFMVSWGYCCYLKVVISSLYIASNCSWKTMSLAIFHWRTVYIVFVRYFYLSWGSSSSQRGGKWR